METYRDLPIADQLLERVPALTVGYSPHFDDLVNFCSAKPTLYAPLVHNTKDFVPFFLKKFQVYNEPPLAGWATETPIDQAIICAFARCSPLAKGQTPPTKLPESEIIERFEFCVTNIHCLDYLDFIIRVLHVITDEAIAFELNAWAEYEDGAALVRDVAAQEWYDKAYLPKILEGQDLNKALDGAVNIIRRTGRMMEVLGTQYRKEVIALINLRPQHTAGSYFIANHVTE